MEHVFGLIGVFFFFRIEPEFSSNKATQILFISKNYLKGTL